MTGRRTRSWAATIKVARRNNIAKLLRRSPSLRRDLPAAIAEVYPNSHMKTAISIPDPVFEAAERLAKRLGKSRSQLFTDAVRAYLERHSDEAITKRINEIVDADPDATKLDPGLDALQLETLRKVEW